MLNKSEFRKFMKDIEAYVEPYDSRLNELVELLRETLEFPAPFLEPEASYYELGRSLRVLFIVTTIAIIIAKIRSSRRKFFLMR